MRKKSFGLNSLSFLDKLLSKLRFKKVLKGINLDDKTILDTGCGYNANLLNYIKENYNSKRIIAYDLKLNKKYLKDKGIEYFEGNLNKGIDLDNDKVDIVFSTAIIEHLEKPHKYTSSIYDILNKDGILVLTIPSVYSKPVLEFLAYKLKIIDKNEIMDHKKYYDKKSILKLLVKSGFKIENIKHRYFQFFMNNYCIVKK